MTEVRTTEARRTTVFTESGYSYLVKFSDGLIRSLMRKITLLPLRNIKIPIRYYRETGSRNIYVSCEIKFRKCIKAPFSINLLSLDVIIDRVPLPKN